MIFAESWLWSKFVFHRWSSPSKKHFPSKVSLSWKLVFNESWSSMEGCLPSEIVFYQMSSSIRGHLLSKAVFHLRLSSIPLKKVLRPKTLPIQFGLNPTKNCLYSTWGGWEKFEIDASSVQSTSVEVGLSKIIYCILWKSLNRTKILVYNSI